MDHSDIGNVVCEVWVDGWIGIGRRRWHPRLTPSGVRGSGPMCRNFCVVACVHPSSDEPLPPFVQFAADLPVLMILEGGIRQCLRGRLSRHHSLSLRAVVLQAKLARWISSHGTERRSASSARCCTRCGSWKRAGHAPMCVHDGVEREPGLIRLRGAATPLAAPGYWRVLAFGPLTSACSLPGRNLSGRRGNISETDPTRTRRFGR
jgi:hypothetical protein